MNPLRLIFIFLVIVFVVQSASAQEADVVSSKLESTRQVFLAAIVDAHTEVVAELDKKIRRAQSADALKTVERITTEKQEFMEEGTTPSSVDMRMFRRKISNALRTMKREFEQAIDNAGKQGEIEEAKRLRDELQTFEEAPYKCASWAFADYEIQSGAEAFRPFTNFARAYTNRSYVWKDISPSWPLKQFAPVAGGSGVPIQITVTSPGWVFMAFSQGDQEEVTAYINSHLWQLTPHVFSYSAAGKTQMRIFRKHLPAGEHVIPWFNFSGPVLIKP